MNHRVLAPLPTTSMSPITNFAAFNEQLRGASNIVEDENQACPCSSKENVSVTFANLFEFTRISNDAVIKESPDSPSRSQGRVNWKSDHSLCESSFDGDGLASSTCKTSNNKRTVSFAPSCQVIHVGNDDNQAHYLGHEPVKEGSSQGCPDGDIGSLGPKKRRGVPQAQNSFNSDAAPCPCEMTKKRAVSFAPSCPTIHLIDDQTLGIEDELWYSRDDFMHFEDEAFLCSQMIQESESRGIFAAELGLILGLEKIILCDSYFDRREILTQTVLNEQAVQQLVKDLKVNDYYFLQGSGNGSNKDSNAEDLSLKRLAKTSDRLSRWARERASMAAFTLEHDLKTQKSYEG